MSSRARAVPRLESPWQWLRARYISHRGVSALRAASTAVTAVAGGARRAASTAVRARVQHLTPSMVVRSELRNERRGEPGPQEPRG